MKRNLILMLACFAAVGLIAAGCDDDDDGGGEALTKEELVAQGNEICATGNEEIDAAAEEIFSEDQQPTPEQEEAFVSDTLVPSIQGQIDDIRDLEGPAGDDETLETILDDAQAALDQLEADPSLVEGDPFADVNASLSEFGLTECAG